MNVNPRALNGRRSRKLRSCALLTVVSFLGIEAHVSQTSATSIFTGAETPIVAGLATQAAPTGDLPGWSQIFRDDFTTNVALGQFPKAVSTKWSAYPSPWTDTSGYGMYSPLKTVSINNGILSKYIHTEGGQPLVAALLPKVPGTGTSRGQMYGRYAVRFRADSLAGYKMAWMLWPDSNTGRDGEIDFPEKNFSSPYVYGFVHHQNATSGSDQYWARTTNNINEWHTTVIEWSPNLVVFLYDGQEIGRTTERVPNTPLHWVLQTETSLTTGTKPSSSIAGNVQIDWIAAWAYDPTSTGAVPGSDQIGPVVAVQGITAGSVLNGTVPLQASCSDPSGVTQVKWYVDGREVGYDGGGAPWYDTLNTTSLPDGNHRIFAKARDGAGNWGSSPSVAFSVNN